MAQHVWKGHELMIMGEWPLPTAASNSKLKKHKVWSTASCIVWA